MTLDFNMNIDFNMNSVVNVTWYRPWHTCGTSCGTGLPDPPPPPPPKTAPWHRGDLDSFPPLLPLKSLLLILKRILFGLVPLNLTLRLPYLLLGLKWILY